MMNETVYQDIFENLEKYLSQSWEKLVVYLEYGINSYSFSFYVKENGEYVKCYDIPDVSDSELAESFRKIDLLVAPQRNNKDSNWTNMTMVVDSSGNMHADFDYSDLSNGTYQYKKDWKNKYLK